MGSLAYGERVAVITGAAGDIGMAIARGFVSLGTRVALTDIDIENLRVRAGAAGLSSDVARSFACDLTDADAIEKLVSDIKAEFGRIDILINNAATTTRASPVVTLSLEEWNQTFSANVTGAFLLCKHVIPIMGSGGGGTIVNIASQLAHVAVKGRTAYGASKAALIALTRGLAIDHAGESIRAVSVSPGSIMTGRLTDRYGSADAVNAKLAPLHPIGRIGTAEEVAAAVIFLAGAEASFITGTDVLVDGGYTAV